MTHDHPYPKNPTTGTEQYLAAILDELQTLSRALAPEAKAGDLREPARPKGLPAPTPLPADFPGRDALHAAGFVYLESVPKSGPQLIAIPDIGRATAVKIMEALT